MNSGIYKILNTFNNKFYIGSSSNLKRRIYEHKRQLKNNEHHCNYLQRSFNKYGKDKFAYIIIEYCTELQLIEREQYYIDTLYPEFNSAPIAGSCLGYKFGKQSDEVCKLKSDNSSRKRKVDLFTIEGIYIESFNSLTEATTKTGVSQIHIREICTGNRYSRNNYRFKYTEDAELIDRKLKIEINKKLYLYDKNMNVLMEDCTIKEISDFLKIKYKTAMYRYKKNKIVKDFYITDKIQK